MTGPYTNIFGRIWKAIRPSCCSHLGPRHYWWYVTDWEEYPYHFSKWRCEQCSFEREDFYMGLEKPVLLNRVLSSPLRHL